MGCTYDDRWSEIIMQEIESDDAEIRYEAARAAGSLELEEAIPKLARLALDDDREILEVAIWSLGEIGGNEAMRILNLLAEKAEDEDDQDLIQAIDEAIGNATLMSMLGDFDGYIDY